MNANGKPRGGRPAILVTGGASGIGRACVELFAQRGWFVGVYDVDAEGAQAVATTLGKENAIAGSLDVSDANAWQRALAEFWMHSGERLDVLFNNAGILAPGPFEAVPLARHEAMLAVNVKGLINGCHCAFHYLQRSPGSRVINMASATAIYGQPDLVTYSATKFAVRGFTEGLDLEWSKFGIRVNDIWPSFVKTNMATSFAPLASAKALGIRLVPEDVAAAVWACVMSKPRFHKTHWLVGLQAWLLALATRIAPSSLSRRVVQYLAR